MAQWQEVYHFEGDQQAYFVILNANFVVIITPPRSSFTIVKKLRNGVIMTTKFVLRVTK